MNSALTVRDQLNRDVRILATPKRIVSLCPSTTETLFALGLATVVVGRTDYCIHPEPDVAAVSTVGGTKTVRIEQIAALQPDLVIAVREENDKSQIEAIAERWPTLILDPVDVPSAIEGIRLLGSATRAVEKTNTLANQITTAFETLTPADDISVVYLIWRKPFMAVGVDNYIDDVLQRLGFRNLARDTNLRYPELDAAKLERDPPQLILASSAPFPFATKHLPELQSLSPRSRAHLVDGEMFSWHGARMLTATRYFAEFLQAL